MTVQGEYSIERAAHKFCAALHMDNINPAEIEIMLPYEAWWRLWTRIEQLHRGVMKFDGRGVLPERFSYMGVTYRPKPVGNCQRPGETI